MRPPEDRRLAGYLGEVDLPGPSPGQCRTVITYLPPAHDRHRPHPVVYMADGELTASFAGALDGAIHARTVPPLVLVGVTSLAALGQERRRDEYVQGGNPTTFEAHRRFFVEEVAAWAEEHLAVARLREKRFVFGVSTGATFAITMGSRHADRFGKVLAFSVAGGLEEPLGWPSGRIPGHYLVAGTLEPGFRRITSDWAERIGRAGGRCDYHEVVGRHDLGTWLQHFPTAVAWAVG